MKILVDTNVWIAFFKGVKSAFPLQSLLLEDQIKLHPLVLGELVLGNLGSNKTILYDLKRLPTTPLHDLSKVLDFFIHEKLQNKGLSLVDAWLFHAASVDGMKLWTFDKALLSLARLHNLEFNVH